MILILETIVETHASRVQGRESHVKVLLRRRLISKVECVGVAAITDSIALKSISFLLVSDSSFILMTSLEPDCLLISQEILAQLPCKSGDALKVLEEHIHLPIWVSLPRRNWQVRILQSKTATKLLKPTLEIVALHNSLYPITSVDRFIILTLEFVLNSWPWSKTMEEIKIDHLLYFVNREWLEVWVQEGSTHIKHCGLFVGVCRDLFD